MKDDTNVFGLSLKTQTNLFLVTSRSFYCTKKNPEIVARLNLDLLWWSLVQFTAIHSSRTKRRVSSTASQKIITDLLQARNTAEVLSGLLGLLTQWGGGADEALCQPLAPNRHFGRGGEGPAVLLLRF